MAKDVNIHVKTTGTDDTKRDLDRVGQSTEKLGDSVESTGRKTSTASEWITGALKKIAGPAGFIAIGAAVAAAAGKIATFFDDIKTRSDEAVRNVQNIRAAYGELFEALDAFDEKSRQRVTKDINALLQQTGVTSELGLPVIDAYTRQFKSMVGTGQLSQEQYNQGQKEMLTYAARHGGLATVDLITIMAGWGMTTPEQQGGLRRMIGKSSQLAGLTEEQLIDALGRSMPTINAMGWTPAESLEKISLLAAGEVGKKRLSLPTTTLQALMTPNLSEAEKLGIPGDIAQDPQKLLIYMRRFNQLSQQGYMRRLTEVYGAEAAAGVYKLHTVPTRGISEALRNAAADSAAEQTEEEGRKTTLEYKDAVTQAAKKKIELDLTEQEKDMEKVREIGEDKQKLLERREPVTQAIRERFTPKELLKEEGAFRQWDDNLTDEEREAIRGEGSRYPGPGAGNQRSPFRVYWEELSAQEKWEALTENPSEASATSGPVIIDNRRITIHNPIAGVNKADLGIGPHVPRDIQ